MTLKSNSKNNIGGSLRLCVSGVAKRFGYRLIFKDITFDIEAGDSLSIAGPNGSGKSTLVRILAGVIRPTEGLVEFFNGNEELIPDEVTHCAGYLAPGVNPYEELTPLENISFVRKNKNTQISSESLLDELGLYEHRNRPVKYFSSGMRQRLGFILAVIKDPDFLFLDEPGMNLDNDGKDRIFKQIDSLKGDRILIIAANEADELSLCDRRIDLG